MKSRSTASKQPTGGGGSDGPRIASAGVGKGRGTSGVQKPSSAGGPLGVAGTSAASVKKTTNTTTGRRAPPVGRGAVALSNMESTLAKLESQLNKLQPQEVSVAPSAKPAQSTLRSGGGGVKATPKVVVRQLPASSDAPTPSVGDARGGGGGASPPMSDETRQIISAIDDFNLFGGNKGSTASTSTTASSSNPQGGPSPAAGADTTTTPSKAPRPPAIGTPTPPRRGLGSSPVAVLPPPSARNTTTTTTTTSSSCGVGGDDELPPLTAETAMSDAVMNQYNRTRGGGVKKVSDGPSSTSGAAVRPVTHYSYTAVHGDELEEEEEEEEREAPHGSVVRLLTAEEVAERNRKTMAMRSSDRLGGGGGGGSTSAVAGGEADDSPSRSLSVGDNRQLPRSGGAAKGKGGTLLSEDFKHALQSAAVAADQRLSRSEGIPSLYFLYLQQCIMATVEGGGGEGKNNSGGAGHADA